MGLEILGGMNELKQNRSKLLGIETHSADINIGNRKVYVKSYVHYLLCGKKSKSHEPINFLVNIVL